MLGLLHKCRSNWVKYSQFYKIIINFVKKHYFCIFLKITQGPIISSVAFSSLPSSSLYFCGDDCSDVRLLIRRGVDGDAAISVAGSVSASYRPRINKSWSERIFHQYTTIWYEQRLIFSVHLSADERTKIKKFVSKTSIKRGNEASKDCIDVIMQLYN